MKKIDFLLQRWRYCKVEPYIPNGCRILDIGGYDGSFLSMLEKKIESGICIDPLIQEMKRGKISLLKFRIENHLPFPDSSFDVVTMLAVYEHLAKNREQITGEVFRVLKVGGQVVLTVPHNLVDYFLKILKTFKLIDGMSMDEHDHFESSQTIILFQKYGFKLLRWRKFQGGLNNLFVFEKLGLNEWKTI